MTKLQSGGVFFTEREFSAYGPSYWTVIAVFVIGAVFLVWIGRRQSASHARLLGRVLVLSDSVGDHDGVAPRHVG